MADASTGFDTIPPGTFLSDQGDEIVDVDPDDFDPPASHHDLETFLRAHGVGFDAYCAHDDCGNMANFQWHVRGLVIHLCRRCCARMKAELRDDRTETT